MDLDWPRLGLVRKYGTSDTVSAFHSASWPLLYKKLPLVYVQVWVIDLRSLNMIEVFFILGTSIRNVFMGESKGAACFGELESTSTEALC